MDFRKEAEALSSYLSGLRREMHMHPEASRQEFWTAGRIEKELDAIGIPDHRRVDGSGVYAVFRGEKPGDRVMTLRADIDALPIREENGELSYCSRQPGVMHACGHDCHAAGLLGGARLLCAHKAEFGGEVRLFFQHAEEIGYGGRVFVREGLLEGSGRVFGIHVASDLKVGTVGIKTGPNNASVDHFRITVRGKAAHVSTPHLGADALYIASQTVVGLQALVTRRFSPTDPLLIGVGRLTAGTAYNIVAEEAVLEGTVRAMTAEVRKNARDWLSELCVQTARLYGGEASVEWTDYATPLVNPELGCREAGEIVADLFGSAALVTDRSVSLGGDDFAEFLLTVPGCYAYVGTRSDDPHTQYPLHSGHVDMDERALPIAAVLHAEYTWRYLTGMIG